MIRYANETDLEILKEYDHHISEKELINSIKLNDIKKTQIEIDAPAFLYQDSYTMLPVRAVAETLDCGVSWDENTQTVNIKYPNS